MTNPTSPTRRALTADELDRVVAAAEHATNTAQLLEQTLTTLYTALRGGDPVELPVRADRYAIPTSQWQAILHAITNRAEQWGTATQVGLELALSLMPSRYDDPHVPVPELHLPDHRPAEHTVVLTRDAVDTITAAENHLAQLAAAYGPTSAAYQNALKSWHTNLTHVLSMGTGDVRVSRDCELSLFVSTSSGLVYALIFHPDTRHCTTPGCGAQIADDGATRPGRRDTPVLDHEHTPSYPLDGPRPGSWAYHS